MAQLAGVRPGIWKMAEPMSICFVCARDEGEHRRRVRAVGLRDPGDGVAEVVGLLGEREVVGVVAAAPVPHVQTELHAALPRRLPRTVAVAHAHPATHDDVDRQHQAQQREREPHRPGTLASAREAATPRTQRPGRLAARARHDDLGPRHRRGRRRRPAARLRRRRRHAGRHRRHLLRRRQRAGARPAARRRRPARRGPGRDQGLRRRRQGADGPRHQPRATCSVRARRLAAPAAARPRRPVAAARLGPGHPVGGGARRRRHRGAVRAGPLRRA